LWCPGEKTPFKEVKKLLPGSYIIYDIEGNSCETKTYYQVPFRGSYAKASEEELVKELEEKLFLAVERQLMSDVPLGFFVSGGIDSSLIAAIASRISGKNSINAFTINSGDELQKEGFSNDLFYSKLVSKNLRFDLNIIDAKIDILSDFDRMIWHLEEPQADPAPLSVYNICKAARKNGIKVLLGGTGADDIFSGYRRHQALSYQKYIDLIPPLVRKALNKTTQGLNTNNPFNRRIKKLFKDIGRSETDRMVGYFSWLPLEVNKGLFARELASYITSYNPDDYLKQILLNIPLETNNLNQLLYLEMKSFLVDHNLNYTDKMSMAAGVEARVPYLDVDLVNFSTRIPPNLKMKGTQTKYLLKKVAEKYLPAEIINRPKAGFGAPVRKWIINDMEEMISQRLSPSRIKNRGIFNSEEVQRLISNNKTGKIDASYTIWSLLAIESWMIQFVDGTNLIQQNN
jgi:asparagine synthase (glutamine-hydrolysing)